MKNGTFCFYEELVNLLKINYLEKLMEISDEIDKYVLSANTNKMLDLVKHLILLFKELFH